MTRDPRCASLVRGATGGWSACPRRARFRVRVRSGEVRLCWPCMARRLQRAPAAGVRIRPPEA